MDLLTFPGCIPATGKDQHPVISGREQKIDVLHQIFNVVVCSGAEAFKSTTKFAIFNVNCSASKTVLNTISLVFSLVTGAQKVPLTSSEHS